MSNVVNTSSEEVFKHFREKRYRDCLNDMKQLARRGDAAAAIAMSHIYFYGGGGVKRDYGEARRWLELVYQDDKSINYAAYRLGVIYYKGLAVRPNRELAYTYFRSSAIRGDAKGLLMVAAMRKGGDAVPIKRRTAQTIFRHSRCNKKLSFFDRALAALWMLRIW